MIFGVLKVWIAKNVIRLASVIGFVLMLFYKTFRLGAKSEQNKQKARSDKLIKERSKNDEKVKSFSDERIRSELSKWVRNKDL